MLRASPAAPEVIYHGGVVLTMEPARPGAEAIAIRSGRVTAAGADDDVLALADRVTRLVDLGGRTVLPGFIDSHAHWIGDREMVGFTPERTIEAALRRGWTSISEQFVNVRRLDRLRELDRSGALRLRVNAYLPLNFDDDKFSRFLDHDRGTRFHWSQVELDHHVLTAHRNGWQVTAHAVSAEAHDQYLTALSRALTAHPFGRATGEQVVQLRDAQLARIRELGVVASIQPGLSGDSAAEAGVPELVARGDTRWIAR